jgi:hypothetical protein
MCVAAETNASEEPTSPLRCILLLLPIAETKDFTRLSFWYKSKSCFRSTFQFYLNERSPDHGLTRVDIFISEHQCPVNFYIKFPTICCDFCNRPKVTKRLGQNKASSRSESASRLRREHSGGCFAPPFAHSFTLAHPRCFGRPSHF